MSTVKASVVFDQATGSAKFTLDLQGTTELDHEILAATFASARSVTIVPAHKGDDLFAEFVITDSTILTKATHALENRKRVADGKPTIEEEQEQVAAREKAREKAQKDADAAAKKSAEDAKAAQEVADQRIADIAAKAAVEAVSRLNQKDK